MEHYTYKHYYYLRKLLQFSHYNVINDSIIPLQFIFFLCNYLFFIQCIVFRYCIHMSKWTPRHVITKLTSLFESSFIFNLYVCKYLKFIFLCRNVKNKPPNLRRLSYTTKGFTYRREYGKERYNCIPQINT